MKPADFIAWVAPMAQRGEREFGVPASVAIGQAILESGWGASRLTREANSFFGIKCHAKASKYQSGCFEIETKEYDASGAAHVEVAKFRSYSSPENSFLDHGYFLRNTSRYKAAFTYQSNPERFLYEIHRAGYATDPSYANQVIGIIHKYDLDRFDVTQRSNATLTPSIFGKLDRGGKAGSTQKFVASVYGDPDGTVTWQVSRDGATWSTVQSAKLDGTYRSIYQRTLKVGDDGLRLRAVVDSSGGSASVAGRLTVTGAVPVTRYGGANRYEVAVNISRAKLANSSRMPVYIANGYAFADALAGAAAASKEGGALLLVEQNSIPDAVRIELERLSPDKVLIQGGAVTVSDKVLREVGAITGAQVIRNDGKNRYEVAAATSRGAFQQGTETVYLVKGTDYPDALSAATYFAKIPGPVILTHPTEGLTDAAFKEIQALAPERAIVLGSRYSVSEADFDKLRGERIEVLRQDGKDRFEVSIGAAQADYPQGAETVYLSAGDKAADGLTIGPLAAKAPGPVLLVRQNCIPEKIQRYLVAHPPKNLVISGGEPSVSNDVAALKACAN